MEEMYCSGCGRLISGEPILVENKTALCMCNKCHEQIFKLMNSASHQEAANYFVEKKKDGVLTEEMMAFLSDSERIKAYVAQNGEREKDYAQQAKEKVADSMGKPDVQDPAKAVMQDAGYCMSTSGQRIQRAAVYITTLVVVASLIGLVALLGAEQIGLGLVIAAVGLVSAWLTYVFLNGFAKLVDNSCITAAQALKAAPKEH